MKKKISLKTGINLIIIIFSIASVTLSGVIVRNMAREKIVSTTIQKNGYIAKSIADNLDLYLSNAMETVNTAAAFSSESDGDFVFIQNEIFRIYDNFSYFDLIFFMDKDGKIQFSKPENTAVTDVNVYQHRDYYEYVKAYKKSTVSRLFMSTILNKPHFVLAAPVFSGDEWIGLIGCGIPLSNIQQIVNKNQEDFDGDVWVLDQTGAVVIEPGKELVKIADLEKPIIKVGDKDIHYQSLIDEKKDVDGIRTWGNEEYETSVRNLEQFGWMVMLEQTSDSMQLEANTFNQRIINALLLVLMMSVFFSVFFSSSITKPIQRLVRDVEKVGGDDFFIAHYDNDTYTEVEELTSAFVKMGDRIHRKIKDVEQANTEILNLRQQLIITLEHLILGVVVCDNSGKVTYVNKRTQEITKYNSDQLIGLDIGELYDQLGIDPNSLKRSPEALSHFLVDVEIELRDKNNDLVPVQIFLTPLTTSENVTDGLMVSINDLSEIKFLEQEIMREDRIRMLGELSASIIHDIGNPLAGISNLLEVLQNGKLSQEETSEAFEIIQTEVGDLNKMVRDFLDYTKNKGIEKDTINLGELINEVVSLFRIEARKRNVSIDMVIEQEDLLMVGNRMELKQALSNIVKNALYAVDNDGVIRIQANRNEGKINILISDDGTGIDEENIERIFNPFFTTKESGTGLGLPIAYKSIKANGGYITVGSSEGKGTNFMITFLE